jgi:hypothetical protein
MKRILLALLITISFVQVSAFADSAGVFPASHCERATAVSPVLKLTPDDKARYFGNEHFCGTSHGLDVYCGIDKTCCPNAPTADSYGCCGTGPDANCCDPEHCCPKGSHCTIIAGVHMCQKD